MSRPTNTYQPLDFTNPHHGTYVTPSLAGNRATYARADRADIASDAAALRGCRSPEFARFDRDGGWTSQKITPYAVDGIHPDAPHHRMFGPAAARDLRGLGRDVTRRLMHFDTAADRLIATVSAMDESAGITLEREASYSRAYWTQRDRRAVLRAAFDRAAELLAAR